MESSSFNECQYCSHFHVCKHLIELVNPLLRDYQQLSIKKTSTPCEHFENKICRSVSTNKCAKFKNCLECFAWYKSETGAKK